MSQMVMQFWRLTGDMQAVMLATSVPSCPSASMKKNWYHQHLFNQDVPVFDPSLTKLNLWIRLIFSGDIDIRSLAHEQPSADQIRRQSNTAPNDDSQNVDFPLLCLVTDGYKATQKCGQVDRRWLLLSLKHSEWLLQELCDTVGPTPWLISSPWPWSQ